MSKPYQYLLADIIIQSILLAINIWWWILNFHTICDTLFTENYQAPIFWTTYLLAVFTRLYQTVSNSRFYHQQQTDWYLLLAWATNTLVFMGYIFAPISFPEERNSIMIGIFWVSALSIFPMLILSLYFYILTFKIYQNT